MSETQKYKNIKDFIKEINEIKNASNLDKKNKTTIFR